MRLFHDQAELLLFVSPAEKGSRVSRSEASPLSPVIWSVPLGQLSAKEKGSLRILSPHRHLVHVQWDSPATEVAEQTSLDVQVGTSSLEAKRLALLEQITEQLETLNQAPAPETLRAMERRFQIEEELNRLQSLWGDDDSQIDREQTVRQPEELDQPTNDTLLLYFQADPQDSSQETSPSDDASRSPWIDSIPPQDSQTQAKPNSGPTFTGGVWLRLLVEDVKWSPSMLLFINGETGRLTRTAQLDGEGIKRAILGQNSLKHSLLKDASVEMEWIDQGYHQRTPLNEKEEHSSSTCPITRLLTSSASHRSNAIQLHLNSLQLVARGLFDLDRERLLLEKQRSRAHETDGVGFFADCSLFHLSEDRQALNPDSMIREVRLCAPLLHRWEPLKYPWELVISGRSLKVIPEEWGEEGLVVRLGEATEVSVHQIDRGVRLTSSQREGCLVGVCDPDGKLLVEKAIPPRGSSELRLPDRPSTQSPQNTEFLG